MLVLKLSQAYIRQYLHLKDITEETRPDTSTTKGIMKIGEMKVLCKTTGKMLLVSERNKDMNIFIEG